MGEDYHPFDRDTGKPVTADEVGQKLHEHLDRLQDVAQAAELGARAAAAVHTARRWVGVLTGCVAWFWGVVRRRVEALDLSDDQEQAVVTKLLAGHYWEKAARRARTAEERQRLRSLAATLHEEAWHAGGLISRAIFAFAPILALTSPSALTAALHASFPVG